MLGVDSLETGSLTETEELHLLGRQVASKPGLSGLCPHHHTALHSFTWVLGTRTQVFTVKQKAHYSPSYPLIPYHISQTNYFIKEPIIEWVRIQWAYVLLGTIKHMMIPFPVKNPTASVAF